MTEVSSGFSRDTDLRVWFRLHPIAPNLPWKFTLPQSWSAKEMIWRATGSQCMDLPDPSNEVCRCKSSSDSGTAPLTDGYAHFHPMYPELTVMFPDAIRNAGEVPLECIRPGGRATGRAGLFIAAVDVIPRGRGGTAIFVDSGPCNPDGQPSQNCFNQPEKYAIVPFEGSGQLDLGHSKPVDVSWAVCCGCGEPPNATPEGETDPCGDSDSQRGFLEVAIDTDDALRRELKQLVDRYQAAIREAEQYRSDFELVSNSCAGWDISLELMKALLGGANAPEGAAAFLRLLGVLENLASEDPSIILTGGPNVEVKLLGVDFSIEDIWGAVSGIYEAANTVGGAGSVSSMEERLEECSGVPLVSNLVYDDAKKHVRALKEAFGVLPDIRRLTTRIQQADTDVYNKWKAFYQACMAEAECRGTGAPACGPTPP